MAFHPDLSGLQGAPSTLTTPSTPTKAGDPSQLLNFDSDDEDLTTPSGSSSLASRLKNLVSSPKKDSKGKGKALAGNGITFYSNPGN